MNSVDKIYKKMKDDTEAIAPKLGESQIQKFFAGKTILVTGATAFLGKALVEKLLRGCADIKKIYILLSNSNQISLDDLKKDVIFETLQKSNPSLIEKISAIEADLKAPNLGLSDENRTKLENEVDIIYQTGGDVKFNHNLPDSLQLEYFGTKSLMDLAMSCKHLLSFVYVSTAYSHSYHQDVEEVFYPPPADTKMAADIVQAATENAAGLNTEALPMILGHWPNVYTFTKSATEDLVRDYGRKATFSCAVFRPSIVVASYKEPVPGWYESNNGPADAFAAMGLGIFRMAYTKDNPYDIVPVDMTTNALLALTWDIVNNKKHDQVAVFNYGSGKVNPVTLKRVYKGLIQWAREEPSVKSWWYPQVCFTKCYPMFLLGQILMHILPGILLAIWSLLQGKKSCCCCCPKSSKCSESSFYFSITDFNIDVKQMAKVWDRMVVADQEQFFCDLRELNWDEFWPSFWRGIRILLIKDPMDTVEEARKRHFKLAIVHYTMSIILALTLLYWSCGFACNILNFFFK